MSTSVRQPRLTVIIPLFNGITTIQAAVESITAQTAFSQMELLVMDGGSTDGTQQLLTQLFKGHPNCRLISEKDSGIYDAMNKGIDYATGEWLYFMGGDDTFADNKVVEGLLAAADANTDVLYGDVVMTDSGEVYGGTFSTARLMRENICHQAMIYRKSVFEKKGKYSLKYRLLSDYVFNLACFSDRTLKKKHVDLVVANYNTTGISSRQQDKELKKDRNMLIRKSFGIAWYLYAITVVPALHYSKLLSGKRS